MPPKTGRCAILEQFQADGFRYMFGNPGTVEEGFLDALWDYPELKYILTLQESIAVMAADGYARATRRPALVQIHSTPGLGNAIGALYQAWRGRSPLVVVGGDAGIRYKDLEAQMAGDLVGMARPVTKWATMIHHSDSVLRVLRRAIKVAGTPPMGPVYVCLPQDVLDAPTTEEIRPTEFPSTRVMPETALVHAAAVALAAARTPMIFVGDGVAYAGAQAELARVAELLGAEVWDSDSGELNISFAHPLYQGATGHMFGEQTLPIMQRGDVVLIVGTYVLPEVYPELGPIFSSHATIIHIDLNPDNIAKNHRIDIGMQSDPRLTLAMLADALQGQMTATETDNARARGRDLENAKHARISQAIDKDHQQRDAQPLQFATFMEQFAERLPANTVLFDEALTNSPAVIRYKPPTNPGQYFLTRGGSLGVGFPGAIGAKLANPDQTVVGFTGDGGGMYTIQALWTAARHKIDTKFIVCNNRSYKLLQLNLLQYWKEQGIAPHNYPLSFDLSEPALKFDELSRAMSVPAARVERPDQIQPAIQQALSTAGPFLIDVVVEGDIHPEMIGTRCGQ